MGEAYWKVIAGQNKQPRIDWSEYLGKSLNKSVAELAAKKKSQSSIIAEIIELAKQNNILQLIDKTRLERLVFIGVSARLAEMKTENTLVKKILAEKLTWRCHVHQFKNGARALFVPDQVILSDGDFLELTAVKIK